MIHKPLPFRGKNKLSGSKRASYLKESVRPWGASKGHGGRIGTDRIHCYKLVNESGCPSFLLFSLPYCLPHVSAFF